MSYVISGPLRGTGPEVTFARTDAIVAAELPIIIGRNGHFGLLFAALAVPLAWWLLYRSTTGFEIRIPAPARMPPATPACIRAGSSS